MEKEEGILDAPPPIKQQKTRNTPAGRGPSIQATLLALLTMTMQYASAQGAPHAQPYTLGSNTWFETKAKEWNVNALKLQMECQYSSEEKKLTDKPPLSAKIHDQIGWMHASNEMRDLILSQQRALWCHSAFSSPDNIHTHFQTYVTLSAMGTLMMSLGPPNTIAFPCPDRNVYAQEYKQDDTSLIKILNKCSGPLNLDEFNSIERWLQCMAVDLLQDSCGKEKSFFKAAFGNLFGGHTKTKLIAVADQPKPGLHPPHQSTEHRGFFKDFAKDDPAMRALARKVLEELKRSSPTPAEEERDEERKFEL